MNAEKFCQKLEEYNEQTLKIIGDSLHFRFLEGEIQVYTVVFSDLIYMPHSVLEYVAKHENLYCEDLEVLCVGYFDTNIEYPSGFLEEFLFAALKNKQILEGLARGDLVKVG